MVNKFLPQLSVTRGLGGFVISFFVAVFRVLVDEMEVNVAYSIQFGAHFLISCGMAGGYAHDRQLFL